MNWAKAVKNLLNVDGNYIQNKIRLLECQSHIELRLIEVEVNLSGISVTSYRGQFDTFFVL